MPTDELGEWISDGRPLSSVAVEIRLLRRRVEDDSPSHVLERNWARYRAASLSRRPI